MRNCIMIWILPKKKNIFSNEATFYLVKRHSHYGQWRHLSHYDNKFFVPVPVLYGIDVKDVWFNRIVQFVTNLMPQPIYWIKCLMTV